MSECVLQQIDCTYRAVKATADLAARLSAIQKDPGFLAAVGGYFSIDYPGGQDCGQLTFYWPGCYEIAVLVLDKRAFEPEFFYPWKWLPIPPEYILGARWEPNPAMFSRAVH
jgi:hypothetical protein